MGNLQKRLLSAGFWVLLQAMFTDRLKTNGTAIKTTRETTNNQQKKYYSVKHIQRQQFSITKTSIKVSLKILSLQASLSLCLKPASWCLLFSKMNSRYENRSNLSFTARITTKYSLERFLSICGEKMSKGFLKFCKLISNLILGQIIVSNLTNVHKLNSRINYARLH